MRELPPRDQWLEADFNGLSGGILCLSHGDTGRTRAGEVVALSAGMLVTAYDNDLDDDGKPDCLVASGVVAPAPWYLSKHGSRWVLELDDDGWAHESER